MDSTQTRAVLSFTNRASASGIAYTRGFEVKCVAQGGGTEADGGKSAEYCGHCYSGGKFTLPDLTAEEIVKRVQ